MRANFVVRSVSTKRVPTRPVEHHRLNRDDRFSVKRMNYSQSNKNDLSKNAQSVQDTLSKKGLHFKVLELAASTRTANDAASTIGCDVAQIVKSLIFRTQNTNKPVLVLASGPNRVNEAKISEYVGEKIVKADATYTKDVTGFPIGGIPPVGHKQPINTLIDEDLLKFKELWAAAGTPNAVFCLNSADIESLTSGRKVSIK